MLLAEDHFRACGCHDDRIPDADRLLDLDAPALDAPHDGLAADRVAREDRRAVAVVETHQAVLGAKGAQDLIREQSAEHLAIDHRCPHPGTAGVLCVVVKAMPIPGGRPVSHHVGELDTALEVWETQAGGQEMGFKISQLSNS